jgi:hypothetical protein
LASGCPRKQISSAYIAHNTNAVEITLSSTEFLKKELHKELGTTENMADLESAPQEISL